MTNRHFIAALLLASTILCFGCGGRQAAVFPKFSGPTKPYHMQGGELTDGHILPADFDVPVGTKPGGTFEFLETPSGARVSVTLYKKAGTQGDQAISSMNQMAEAKDQYRRVAANGWMGFEEITTDPGASSRVLFLTRSDEILSLSLRWTVSKSNSRKEAEDLSHTVVWTIRSSSG